MSVCVFWSQKTLISKIISMGNKKKSKDRFSAAEEVESEYDTDKHRWRRLATVTLYLESSSFGDHGDDIIDPLKNLRKRGRKEDPKVICECTRLFCK